MIRKYHSEYRKKLVQTLKDPQYLYGRFAETDKKRSDTFEYIINIGERVYKVLHVNNFQFKKVDKPDLYQTFDFIFQDPEISIKDKVPEKLAKYRYYLAEASEAELKKSRLNCVNLNKFHETLSAYKFNTADVNYKDVLPKRSRQVTQSKVMKFQINEYCSLIKNNAGKLCLTKSVLNKIMLGLTKDI